MLQSWETTTAILRLANECKLLPTVINLLMLSRSPFDMRISEEQDFLNRVDISDNFG
jgi:hypothetical protein